MPEVYHNRSHNRNAGGNTMAKIVKSIFGGGIVYEISRYSEEEKRLDKECKKLEAYGSVKITFPEKIQYYLPITKK